MFSSVVRLLTSRLKYSQEVTAYRYLLIMALAVPFSAHAITSGETVQGSIITDGGVDSYPIFLQTGESILVRVNGFTSAERYRLELYGPGNSNLTGSVGDSFNYQATVTSYN